MNTLPLVALAALSLAQAKPKPVPAVKNPAPVAVAPVAVPLSVQLEQLLSGYEYVPSRADFDKLGPGVVAELQRLAHDATKLPTLRLRAVSSLALVSDEAAAVPALKALVAETKLDARLRARAVQALTERVGDQAFDAVKPLASSPEARLREAAARALSRMSRAEATSTLDAMGARETDDGVKAVLDARAH